MSYQAGFDEGLDYSIGLLEDLLYDWEGSDTIDTYDVQKVLNQLHKAKTN